MADAEKQEENITNKLLVRLDILRQEKADLAMKVEQEEEYLTNTLQKKLETVRIARYDDFQIRSNYCSQTQHKVVHRIPMAVYFSKIVLSTERRSRFQQAHVTS
jgi:RecJ-like exonuclease